MNHSDASFIKLLNIDLYEKENIMRTESNVKSKKATRITVSVATDDHSRLTELAEQYDVSVSWLVRHSVGEFLDRVSNGDGQLSLPLDRRGTQQ